MNAHAADIAARNPQALPAARYLVVGLGKTGLSCARFLARAGRQVSVMDSRAEPPGLNELRAEFPQLEVVCGGFDAARMAAAEVLVVSPGVSVREPAIVAAHAAGVEVVGDIELFARLNRAPVVAITGSNGKSTVTTLVGEMARAAGRQVAVGGNLGTPALELLERDYELCVLELSSFQLETTASLRPAAAAVLNISADHMDRYATVEEYAAAKRGVYAGDGVMVVNADDPMVMAMVEPGRKVVRFSVDPKAAADYRLQTVAGEAWLVHGDDALLPAREVRIPGRHNLANALAALALGEAVGLPRAAMVATLQTFAGLPHRTQWVGEAHGVNFYDDSKGTNVGATVAAIQGLAGQVVLIAGGDGKGADFSELRGAVSGKARHVVLIGRDGPRIAAAIEGAAPYSYAADMPAAVRAAAAVAQAGDSVLLSPACASFDMFRNYEHRGEVFAAAVEEWVHGH